MKIVAENFPKVREVIIRYRGYETGDDSAARRIKREKKKALSSLEFEKFNEELTHMQQLLRRMTQAKEKPAIAFQKIFFSKLPAHVQEQLLGNSLVSDD